MALGLLMLGAALWSIGFANFLSLLPDELIVFEATDDLGIVVFTGGLNRMITGMEVLTNGDGSRLLISGVNEASSRDALRGHITDPNDLFDCCVDLDYASQDTMQNATHSLLWAHENEFSSLLVVTSYYHMPRALLELNHRGETIEAIAYPVFPDPFDENQWWHPHKFRILAFEYSKYELALMRIRLSNLLG